MAILRMTHIGVCVTDLARATAFYRDGLGFRSRSELRVAGPPSTTLLRLPEVDLQAVYLERDGTRIELLHYVAPGAVGDGAAASDERSRSHPSLPARRRPARHPAGAARRSAVGCSRRR